MKKTFAIIVTSAFALANASAVVIYSTDFTSADGFANSTQINGVDGWTAQTNITTTNVTTTGQAITNSNFTRGYQAGSAFAVGETITITAGIASLLGTAPGFDANLFQIGLTSDTNLATAQVQAGVNLGGGSNDLFDIAVKNFAGPGTKEDTAISIDTSFHTLSTTITKTATTNNFLVTISLDGILHSGGPFTVTDAALYSAADVYPILFFAGQSNTGGIAVDSFSVVPEPSSVTLLGFGVASLIVRRRRA